MAQTADARNNKPVKKSTARGNHGFRFAEIMKARAMSRPQGRMDGRTYPGSLDVEALKKITGKKAHRARKKVMATACESASPPLRAPNGNHASQVTHGSKPISTTGPKYQNGRTWWNSGVR